jgi:hypothetical protein
MKILNRLIALGVVMPLLGGGFWLELGSPTASSDPKARGAVVVALFIGCHEPEKAVLKATAEGVVQGKRQTLALSPVALSTPGVYAISRTWPAEGKWVLKLEGRYPAVSGVTSTFVKLTGDSFDRKGAVMKPGVADTEALEAMLR